MHILITGHLGYIGSVMTKLFRKAGHTVTGLDIGYYRDCFLDTEGTEPPDHETMLDIRAAKSEDLKGADAIVHLAGLSNESMARMNTSVTHQINYEGTMRLARYAKHIGIPRFVFASACGIYGAAGRNDRKLTEADPIMPMTELSSVKAMAERGLSALADEAFCPVYLRYATVYGASPRMRFDTMVNNLVGWAVSTGKVKVVSDGTVWRPVVHVEDVAWATLAAVQASAESVHDQAFNIGRHDCNYQVREVAETIKRYVIGSEVVIAGESSENDQSYQVDCTRAAERLPGFSPEWTLENGVRELIRWFRDRYRDAPPFYSRHFIRLRQLEHLMETGEVDDQLRRTGPGL